MQKVESISTFWNKICTCCAFYQPKANLFCSKWQSDVTSLYGVTPAYFYAIRSQYSRKLQQALFVARQVWVWVVKRVTSLFNTFCSNGHIFVARFTVALETSASFTGFLTLARWATIAFWDNRIVAFWFTTSYLLAGHFVQFIRTMAWNAVLVVCLPSFASYVPTVTRFFLSTFCKLTA